MRIALIAVLFAATSAVADVPKEVREPESSPPLSIWRATADGGAEHLQSGLICPSGSGPFHRVATTVFDAFGLDVGCSYASPEATLTVYLTRRSGSDIAAALAEAKRELLQFGASRHPVALAEQSRADFGLLWTVVPYDEDGGLRSSIWIADLNGWTLEYRTTTKSADDLAMSSRLGAVTDAIRNSAGVRLALCARSQAPRRGAALMKRTKEISESSLMTSLLGAAAVSAAQESPVQTLPEPTWCFEDAATKAGYNLVVARGVRADGSDANADQVTLLTQERPPILSVASNSLAAVLAE